MSKKPNNSNINEYVTVAEASKRSRYSKRQIRKLAEQGVERIRTKKLDNKHILFNLKDIIQYAAAHPEETILNTVWDEIDYREGEAFYMLPGYDCKYYVSNQCRVINNSNGQVLTPQLQKAGYKKVILMRYGKEKNEKLHRLVAQTQCPNALLKNEVHHIKPHNPSNDKASNLVWVTKPQHDELHRLLRENKTKEYSKMVNEIKKENSQKTYKIPHMDFENNDNFNFYMLLSADGYKAYTEGKLMPMNAILAEFAESKE